MEIKDISNYSNGQKNVISILPVRQISSECQFDTFHYVEEIQNLNETSSNLNSEEYNNSSPQDLRLCKRPESQFKAEDIGWLPTGSPKKITITPIYLSSELPSATAQLISNVQFCHRFSHSGNELVHC